MLAAKSQLHLHNIWSRNIFPFNMEDCVLYLPLWQEDMQGTTVLSYDQYHHSCTVEGATWGSQGRIFAGGDDYLKSVQDQWRPTDQSGTIIVWFKTSTIAVQTFFASSDEAGSTRYILFGITGDQFVYVQDYNGVTSNLVRGNGLFADGAWHQAALVSSGTAWSIIVDGVAETLTTDAGSNNGNWFADIPDRDNFSVGALVRSSVGGYFTGTIGEVLVYNRALSLGEVQNNRLATKWRYN